MPSGWRNVLTGTASGQDVELQQRFLAASAIAREAGALMRRMFRERPARATIDFKGPQDYFTESDQEVEDLVRSRLSKVFPLDSFFGEEGGGSLEDDVWVVDPIDGTANFARGIPHFCISIAFVRRRRVEIGIIFEPIGQELYAARRGHGATLDGRPMRVSGLADMARATVEMGWSPRLPPEPYVEVVRLAKHAGANVRRAGSGALALAYVADARIDAYCELHINAWDALAGLLLVEEAGGWTNDFLGAGGLERGNPILACTPGLREPLTHFMGL